VFDQFRREGHLDPTAFQRFRREVLEPGATVEPDELIQRFLGRAASESAFLDELTRADRESPRGPADRQ